MDALSVLQADTAKTAGAGDNRGAILEADGKKIPDFSESYAKHVEAEGDGLVKGALMAAIPEPPAVEGDSTEMIGDSMDGSDAVPTSSQEEPPVGLKAEDSAETIENVQLEEIVTDVIQTPDEPLAAVEPESVMPNLDGPDDEPSTPKSDKSEGKGAVEAAEAPPVLDRNNPLDDAKLTPNPPILAGEGRKVAEDLSMNARLVVSNLDASASKSTPVISVSVERDVKQPVPTNKPDIAISSESARIAKVMRVLPQPDEAEDRRLVLSEKFDSMQPTDRVRDLFISNSANVVSSGQKPAMTSMSKIAVADPVDLPRVSNLSLMPEPIVALEGRGSENVTQASRLDIGPQAARAVTQQVAYAISQNIPGTTEIKLSPEELGRVKMTVQAVDGLINIMVAAERPETGDLMRRHSEWLAEELRNLGFDDINLNFQSSNSQDQADQSDLSDDAFEADVLLTPALEDQPRDRMIIGSDGLDLRL